MTQITLYPSDDTYVDSANAGTYFNTSQYLYVGEPDTGSGQQISYLKWDFTSVPRNALITSATIYVTVWTQNANKDAWKYFNQVTTSWTGGTMNWNNKASYSGNTYASFYQVDNQTNGTVKSASFSVSAIQGWINGTINNYGVAFFSQYQNDDRYMYYSVDQGGSYRPKLVIDYTIWGGALIGMI